MAGVALIDGNSIGFAAQSGTKLHAAGRETQAIFGFFRTLRNLTVAAPDFTPIILWDGKTWRREVFAEYKASRDKDPRAARERAAYRAQRPHIGAGLISLGVAQVVGEVLEADDLAGIMSRGAVAAGKDVLLVTGDTDWLQLIDERVTWYDPTNRTGVGTRRCDLEHFAEFTGYRSPASYLEGKCLRGDTGDEIPGVGGIGDKGAPQLLQEYGTVANFIATAPTVKKLPKKWRELAELPERQAAYRRNLMLMNLREPPPVANKNHRVIKRPFDAAGFAQFCREHQFHSMLSTLDVWTAPFNKS